jgi:hypothetical protein
VTDTAAPNQASPETPREEVPPTDDRMPDEPQAAAASTAGIANAGRPSSSEQQTPAPYESRAAAEPAAAAPNGSGRAPLFDESASGDLRRRWDGIQTGFVDEPRGAVEQADALVAECMQRLADTFAHERQGLEQQWSRGDDVSTEDLRVALRRYRSFFDRLLAL